MGFIVLFKYQSLIFLKIGVIKKNLLSITLKLSFDIIIDLFMLRDFQGQKFHANMNSKHKVIAIIDFISLFHISIHKIDTWKTYIHMSPLHQVTSSNIWLTHGGSTHMYFRNTAPPIQDMHVSYTTTFESNQKDHFSRKLDFELSSIVNDSNLLIYGSRKFLKDHFSQKSRL